MRCVNLPEKDFSSFIGQYVMDVDTDHDVFLRLFFRMVGCLLNARGDFVTKLKF
jgi:hypothetical protein